MFICFDNTGYNLNFSQQNISADKIVSVVKSRIIKSLFIIGRVQNITNRNEQKLTKTNRNRQKPTETNRNQPKLTETNRSHPKPTKTN